MTRPLKTTPFLQLRVQPWNLVTAGGAVLATTTVLAFLGRFWWILDLFSHFRAQMFLGLTAVALLLLIPRRYKASACLGLFGLVNAGTIAPLYFGQEPPPPELSRPYRSLLMNVNTESGQPAKVAQLIQQLNPDFVVLEEVSQRWLSALAVALRAYPHSEVMPREDNFGIALYSKHPFVRSDIREVGEANIPSVVAELQLPDGRLTVIATHPLPPSSRENSRLRDGQLARLPAIVKQATSPVLLLGDLNATPWCAPFKQLLRESGLRDSSQGCGLLPTWPTFQPLFLIPIDHALHTTGLGVTRKALGPKVGSDHFPLIIDFALTSPSSSSHQPPAPPTAIPPRR